MPLFEPTPPSQPWYRSGWKITLLFLGFFLLTAVFLFGIITHRYYQEIKAGRGELLAQRFSNFTPVAGANSEPVAAIDRQALEITDRPTLGRSNAPVVIVEFICFKCANSKLAAPIVRRVATEYGSKVSIRLRFLPTESTHPGASKLAELGYCAYQQGRFWPVHDWLYEQQDTLPDVLTVNDLKNIADTFSLDMTNFQKCLIAPQTNAAINKDYTDAIRFGARGTPTFFINGQKVDGAIPWAAWESILKKY